MGKPASWTCAQRRVLWASLLLSTFIVTGITLHLSDRAGALCRSYQQIDIGCLADQAEAQIGMHQMALAYADPDDLLVLDESGVVPRRYATVRYYVVDVYCVQLFVNPLSGRVECKRLLRLGPTARGEEPGAGLRQNGRSIWERIVP